VESTADKRGEFSQSQRSYAAAQLGYEHVWGRWPFVSALILQSFDLATHIEVVALELGYLNVVFR